MYLLDTNIFLKLLLDQEKADEVEKLLRSMQQEKLHITEFSLYSIGIMLFRRKLFDVFVRFVNDLIVIGGIRLLRLPVEEIQRVAEIGQQFSLDFDDAYQYVAAERYGLTIVSFDKDFDRTEKGRKVPGDLLTE